VHPILYDVLYRVGAPWDGPPRPELVSLVESGILAPNRLAPGRAIDLGCGAGSNSVFLARHGFETVGVDLSEIALRMARERARTAGVSDHLRFVRADLTAEELPGVPGPFDLLVDYGTLDDLVGRPRRAMAELITRLARPGGRFLLWCFHGDRSRLPVLSFRGPSRYLTPVIEPGEETDLFGGAFDIERLAEPPPGSGAACFLMTRRAD
jgi:cyclopropane fatty-acyl-phospholipid synthase-like methyltransferase